MSVELIESPARFAALGPAWDALYRADPAAQVFLSHRWLSDLFGRRPGVCVLAWHDDASEDPSASLGAVWPLRRELVLDRERRRFRGEVLMAGNHWADYTGVLCRPGEELRALPALGERLRTLPWERLRLASLRVSPERLALLTARLGVETHDTHATPAHDNGGRTRLDLAPRIALPESVDAWLAGLGAGTRQRLRRYRRKLDADPALELLTSDATTREADLRAFRELWLRRWRAAKGEDAETKADKYVAILADGLASEQLRLELLCAAGSVVAAAAVYVDPVRRAYSFYAGARDEAFEALPAGLLLHAWLIERAIEEGFEVYDFLRGDEPYKYSLGARDEQLYDRVVRPAPPMPEHVMLDPCHRDAALAAIEAARPSAARRTIGRLYSQLLESWPEEPLVLERYDAWLAEGGDEIAGETAGEAADEIVDEAAGESADETPSVEPPAEAPPYGDGTVASPPRDEARGGG